MYKVRIYYEDTDSGHVVYYSNYLRYFERARVELLREHGINLKQLTEKGIHFVVAEVEVKFLSYAVLDDLLEIETKIKDVKNVSFLIEYFIKRENKIIVKGTTKMACINDKHTLTRIPTEIQQILKLLD